MIPTERGKRIISISKTEPNQQGDFPSGPVVKTHASTAGGTGSIPGCRYEDPAGLVEVSKT